MAGDWGQRLYRKSDQAAPEARGLIFSPLEFYTCVKIFCKVKELVYFGFTTRLTSVYVSSFNSICQRLARKTVNIVRTWPCASRPRMRCAAGKSGLEMPGAPTPLWFIHRALATPCAPTCKFHFHRNLIPRPLNYLS